MESPHADSGLSDYSVYWNQPFANGIDSEEKTFECDGAEQGGTVRCNKAWSRNFVAIQSQPRFGYGPNIPLSAGNHDALRAGGFQLKPLCKRSWQDAERSTGIHKKLDFFSAPGRTSQMDINVEQSHTRMLEKTRTF